MVNVMITLLMLTDYIGRGKTQFLLHAEIPCYLLVCQVKAMSALLSGEMKDTVQMNPAGAYGTDPMPTVYSLLSLITGPLFAEQFWSGFSPAGNVRTCSAVGPVVQVCG